jgi:hypothetical protein
MLSHIFYTHGSKYIAMGIIFVKRNSQGGNFMPFLTSNCDETKLTFRPGLT